MESKVIQQFLGEIDGVKFEKALPVLVRELNK